MRRLNVWLEAFADPIGTLSANDDGSTAFVYSDAYLGLPDAYPISLSLPLREQPHGNLVTRPFFRNLLPENDQLDQLVEREGLERSDVVGILTHLGADLSGALSCLPEDAPPVKTPGNFSTDYDPIAEDDIRDIARRLGSNAPLPDELRDPSPVAGYQRKVALTVLPDGRYAIPKRDIGVPTTHILKVPDTALPHEARYEVICARLADHVGLDAAASQSL